MAMSSRRNKFQLPPLLWRAPKFSNLKLIQKSALSSPFKLPIHELLVPPSARRRVRIRCIDFDGSEQVLVTHRRRRPLAAGSGASRQVLQRASASRCRRIRNFV